MNVETAVTLPKHIKDFRDGWKHVFRKNDAIENLAAERKAVCQDCPHRKLLVCGLCGCPLPAKQRALGATCPDNRWAG